MPDKKQVFIASDHAGFELKEAMQPIIEGLGYVVIDCGPDAFVSDDDYPDHIAPLAKRVMQEESLGIIFGGSGQGEAIVANRIAGIRAAVYYGGSEDIVRLSREHNDANVLSVGARFCTQEEAQSAIELWLRTPFSQAERHVRRLKKLSELMVS